jgi:DnaJ-class molecular chaperone
LKEDLAAFEFAALPTEMELKRAFDRIAMRVHPDHGGDADVFHEYRERYNRLMTQIRKPKKCPTCKGKGTQAVLLGFTTRLERCKSCNGRGSVIADPRVEDLCARLDDIAGKVPDAAGVIEQVKERLRR